MHAPTGKDHVPCLELTKQPHPTDHCCNSELWTGMLMVWKRELTLACIIVVAVVALFISIQATNSNFQPLKKKNCELLESHEYKKSIQYV